MSTFPSQPEWLMQACAIFWSGWLMVCAVAAAPSYRFDHWAMDDGLPQNTVRAIRQTRDGYLWLATFDGLVRFDGQRFTVFNKGNTKGIGSNRFDQLFEDRYGTLWVVTDENYVVRYQADVFTTWTPQEGLPPWWILQLTEDASGHLQIIAREGIAQWQNGWVITCTREELMPQQAQVIHPEGNVLAWLSGDALFVYSHGKVISYSLRAGLPSLNIISMVEDQYGTLWLQTTDVGMVRLRDGQFTVYPIMTKQRRSFLAMEDRRHNVWLSDYGNWLGLYRDGQLTRHTSERGLRSVQACYEDREGNLWIGTNEGLYRARETPINGFTRQNGLASDNVYSIYEDRAGQLWFGTWGGGVTRYQNGCITHYRRRDGLDIDDITALYADRDGVMWIGTGMGLFRFAQPALPGCPAQPARLQPLPAPTEFFRGGVWAIHQDQSGSYWFATSHGLVKYADGRYTRYTTADGLVGDEVKVILEDGSGALWIGTWGGLSRFADGRFTSYTEPDGLASNHLRTLYQDDAGTLWIGTYDGGLSRYKDGRFTRYTTQDGLFNNGVFQILDDARGYFWMSCNQGIYRVRRQELNDFADGKIRTIHSIAYGKEDGLLNVECNGGRQPAGWKTRDGKLWFPTAQGAAVVDPARMEINAQAPPVVIEAVRRNNEDAPLSHVIEIQPEQNNSLEIRYQGLSFIRPEQQRFQYQLAGIDDNWIAADTRRTAYYNRLPPGEYVFTVRAANSDGVWNLQGASLRLKVLPSVWQTWWFRSLSVAAILGLVLLLFQRRIARLKREQQVRDLHARQLIDEQERDRQRIAYDLHASLGQAVNLISNQALDGLDEPDNYDRTTERFAKIAALIRDANKDLHRVAYNLRPPELDERGLMQALTALLARFNSMSAVVFTSDLAPLDALLDNESQMHLYRIVQESLNNIVQHAAATQAHIAIHPATDALRIEIQDNGRGFAVPERPSGLGLSGITERAHLLGGEAEIRSAPGQGTQITVIIPLPENKP